MAQRKKPSVKCNLTTARDKEILASVRAGFVMQRTTFFAYCEQNDIHRGNAERAILKQSNGKKARALRSRMIQASKAKQAKATQEAIQ